jgi:hypothetical protein
VAKKTGAAPSQCARNVERIFAFFVVCPAFPPFRGLIATHTSQLAPNTELHLAPSPVMFGAGWKKTFSNCSPNYVFASRWCSRCSGRRCCCTWMLRVSGGTRRLFVARVCFADTALFSDDDIARVCPALGSAPARAWRRALQNMLRCWGMSHSCHVCWVLVVRFEL